MLRQPGGPPSAVVVGVGRGHQGEAPIGPEAVGRQSTEGDGHGRQGAEGVQRPTTAQHAVDDVAGEGRERPGRLVDGPHVQARLEDQPGGRLPGPARQPGHDAGPAGRGLDDLDIEADAIEEGRQGGCVARLSTGPVAPLVDAGVGHHGPRQERGPGSRIPPAAHGGESVGRPAGRARGCATLLA